MLLLAACHRGPPRAPAIGEAYAGPATLSLRSDIPLESRTVATARHGERLEILQRRRVFIRVRTPSGAEGWTEARQLLAAADMAAMNDLAARAVKMPVVGVAVSYEDLNVHTQPSRQAPSFLLIKAKEKFDVLGHAAVPATDLPRAPLIPPKPKKQAPPPKKSTTGKYPPPPMPKPPPLPADWLELSRREEEEPVEETPSTPPARPADWSLIRTASGQIGWVLTRRISMNIPDEVAQYAEGRRIVSYFSLGTMMDGDEKKNIWLWTTIADGTHPYDFDSFRVFIWSLRRHRYETAYIERNLQGYLPVLRQEVTMATGSKASSTAKYPGFSICFDRKDGSRQRRRYALLTNIVRSAGDEPCELPPPVYQPPVQSASTLGAPAPAITPQAAPEEGFAAKVRRKLHELTHRQ
jgi:hypothetical protein